MTRRRRGRSRAVVVAPGPDDVGRRRQDDIRHVEQEQSRLWNDNMITIIIVTVAIPLRSTKEFYTAGMIIGTTIVAAIVRVLIWLEIQRGVCDAKGNVYKFKRHPLAAQGGRRRGTAAILTPTQEMIVHDHPSLLPVRSLFMMRLLIDRLLIAMVVLNSIGKAVSWTPLFWWRLLYQLTFFVHAINRHDEGALF